MGAENMVEIQSDLRSGVTAAERYGFTGEVVTAALRYAGLDESHLRIGPNPDSGEECLFLAADIRQYSAFLCHLVAYYGAADVGTAFIGQVRIEHDDAEDTRFWFPGASEVAALPR